MELQELSFNNKPMFDALNNNHQINNNIIYIKKNIDTVVDINNHFYELFFHGNLSLSAQFWQAWDLLALEKSSKFIDNPIDIWIIDINYLFRFFEETRKNPNRIIDTWFQFDNYSLSLNYNSNKKCFYFYFIDIVNEKYNCFWSLLWLLNTLNDYHIETFNHIERVSIISLYLLQKLEEKWLVMKTEVLKQGVFFWSMLHDVWKLSLPINLLNKPWKLTKEEYDIIKTHSCEWVKALDIFKLSHDLEFSKIIRNIILYHHEKWDWTWYPEWLSWEQIPFEARLVAISDVFEALLSKRSYKDSCNRQEILDIFKLWCWKHFDPEITNIFFEYFDDILDVL